VAICARFQGKRTGRNKAKWGNKLVLEWLGHIFSIVNERHRRRQEKRDVVGEQHSYS
jgi:hypothetical protein